MKKALRKRIGARERLRHAPTTPSRHQPRTAHNAATPAPDTPPHHTRGRRRAHHPRPPASPPVILGTQQRPRRDRQAASTSPHAPVPQPALPETGKLPRGNSAKKQTEGATRRAGEAATAPTPVSPKRFSKKTKRTARALGSHPKKNAGACYEHAPAPKKNKGPPGQQACKRAVPPNCVTLVL